MPAETPDQVSGDLTDPEGRYAVVVASWNSLVTEQLLAGAVAEFARREVSADRVSVFRVPGSFELPMATHKAAASGRYAAVIALGAVIQGETTHHEYINSQVAAGLQQSTRETGRPCIFGLLTVSSLEQALERAGGKLGNKGAEAAAVAVEMATLLPKIG